MTANQSTKDYRLVWLHTRLQGECVQLAWNDDAFLEMRKIPVTLADVLYVLRRATSIEGVYNGDCFLVCGKDLDGISLCVVVAPPSQKDRVRVVKIWKGL